MLCLSWIKHATAREIRSRIYIAIRTKRSTIEQSIENGGRSNETVYIGSLR